MYYCPFFSLRAATILYGVLRITLSVSEGTGFRPNRPLADAQGYSPPRNATNGLRLAAMRGRLQPAAGFSPPKSANLAEIFGQWGTPPLCKEQPLGCDISAPRQSPARAGVCQRIDEFLKGIFVYGPTPDTTAPVRCICRRRASRSAWSLRFQLHNIVRVPSA